MVESALGRSFLSHRKPRIAQIQGPLRFDVTSALDHLGPDLANNGMSIHSYAASCGHACCTSKHELKPSCFPDLKSPFLSKSAQSFRLLQKKVICVSQHTVKMRFQDLVSLLQSAPHSEKLFEQRIRRYNVQTQSCASNIYVCHDTVVQASTWLIYIHPLRRQRCHRLQI
jgi:hypothetical protein